MSATSYSAKDLFVALLFRGGGSHGNRLDIVRRVSFLMGISLFVVLGSVLALSTPSFAMGGGGGGGSAPAPKVTKVNPVAESREETAETKNPVAKPDERTTEFPKPDDNAGESDADTGDKTVNKPDAIRATIEFATSNPVEVQEGRTANIQIAISAPLLEPVTLSLRMVGTATENSDFVLSDTVTFSRGSTTAIASLTVLDDIVPESNETIALTLGGVLPDGVIFGRQSHTITIPANDQVEETPEVVIDTEKKEIPEVVVKPDDETGDEIVEATIGFATRTTQLEEGELASLQVVISDPLPEDVTLTLSEDGGENNIDFSLRTIVLRAGETSVSVDITAAEDSDADNESVILFLRSVGVLPDGVEFGIHAHTVTIIDDDIADEIEVVEASVGFETATTRMEEGETVPVQVVLGGPFSQSVTLTLSKEDSGNDIELSPRTLTFRPGETNKIVSLTAVEDNIVESTESVLILLNGNVPDDVLLRGIHGHTVTITDNDFATVEFATSNPVEVREGETANIQIAFSASLPEPVELVLHGTGTASADDFATSLSHSFEIPQGTTTWIVSFVVRDDDEPEPDETIVFELTGGVGLPSNITVGAKNTHTLIIPANDQVEETPKVVVDTEKEETPEVAIKPDDDASDEIIEATVGFATGATQMKEGEPASLQVLLSNPLPVDLTLALSEYGGEDNIDFSPRTIVFHAGDTSVSVDIMVAEGFDADNESAVLSLRSTSVLPAGVKFGIYAHTVTIIDDDVADDVDDSQITEVVEKPAEEIPEIVIKPDTDGNPGDENAKADGKNIDIINEENVSRIEAENRDNYYISIENLDVVDWNIKATHHGSENSESGKISIKNATQGDVLWNIVAWHFGNNDISIENWGNVRWNIKTMHRGDGKIDIVNEGDIGWSIRARHYGNNNLLVKNVGTIGGIIRAIHRGIGDIAIENHGDVNGINILHKGAGDIRIENHGDTGDLHVRHGGSSGTTYYSGLINDDYCYEIHSNRTRLENAVFSANGFLDIDGDYEGTKETHLNFDVGLNGNNEGYGGNLLVTGEATGQSRVSLIGELIDDPSLINENIHFPDLIWVDGQAQPDTFVGEQVVGPYKYVLEYELDDDESNLVDEHSWHFNNKGLSDTAKKVAKIPDNTKKDIKTPPATDPDKKKELGLWGGADSSHTDIGLSFPAFVSNDDYHVGSQVQYYLKEDRTGIRALVETEYDFDIMNFRITPHARLTWTRVGFDDFVGPNRERISLVDGDTIDLGLGLSFDNEYQISNGLARIYGGANLLSPLDGETSVRISGFTIVNEQDDLSVDGKLGLSYEWGEGYAVHGEASATDHDGDDEIRADLRASIDF